MSDPRVSASENLEELASRAVEHALGKGAFEAKATARRGSSTSVQYRDGDLETLHEARSSSVSVALYVDGRFSTHVTSDLSPGALEAFIERAISLTRLLGEDPNRGLADPHLYEGRSTCDLEIWDESHDRVSVDLRKELARAAEASARAAEGPVISATGSYSDQQSELVRVHSNGFFGTHGGTQYWLGAEVSVRDEEGRRPEDWHFAGGRHLSDLPSPEEVGEKASARALSRLGQRKLSSGELKILVDSRAAGRLVGALLGALSGAAVQQRRSFLLGKLKERVASPLLVLTDEPLLVRGFGSRHFDGDGIAARRRGIFERGEPEQYLLDVYYARKLGMQPTGGGISNLVMPPGDKDVTGLAKEMGEGVYVTSILGGNCDGTTGDFSHGIVGYEVSGGEISGPVGEMNITGSHSDLWERLVAVGNDPYRYSSHRLPSILLDGVATSGS